MFAAIDEENRRAVFRFRSPIISDPRWELYTSTFERLGGLPGPPMCLICISEAGSGMPDARWRKRFAEVASHLRRDTVFVLVAQSPFARGIVTAVNWIRPFPFHHSVVSTWGEALDFVVRFDRSPALRGELAALLERAAPIPA